MILHFLGSNVVEWEESEWSSSACACCHGNHERTSERWEGTWWGSVPPYLTNVVNWRSFGEIHIYWPLKTFCWMSSAFKSNMEHWNYVYRSCRPYYLMVINSYWLFFQLLSRTQQKAGFIYMAEGYFTEAASLMREGGLDPREVYTTCFIFGVDGDLTFSLVRMFCVKLNSESCMTDKLRDFTWALRRKKVKLTFAVCFEVNSERTCAGQASAKEKKAKAFCQSENVWQQDSHKPRAAN